MGLTFEECAPFMCGQDGSQSQLLACAQAGYNGNLGCDNPICIQGGYCPTPAAATPNLPAQPVPRVTQAQIGVAQSAAPSQPVTRLTPQTLVRPLPNITASLAPAPPAPNCTPWDQLNQAISEYPLIAVAALAGLYFLLRQR
jgi:hypothetical protein